MGSGRLGSLGRTTKFSRSVKFAVGMGLLG